MPVIESRALELFVVDGEAHRLDDMQARAGGGAGAGDIARILRDFRFNQNEIERRHGGISP